MAELAADVFFNSLGLNRFDCRHHRLGHHPVHRPLHHLRRLHQEEEEGRKEIVCNGEKILLLLPKRTNLAC